ncbi:MAG: hypothetical protein ACREFU_18035 [Acetobacteraceae bacterium]
MIDKDKTEPRDEDPVEEEPAEEELVEEEPAQDQGLMVTIGDVVVFDSEADATGTPSKVGQKIPFRPTLPPLDEDEE